jgi:hypothetical protein
MESSNRIFERGDRELEVGRTRPAFYEVSGLDLAVANEAMRQATMRYHSKPY